MSNFSNVFPNKEERNDFWIALVVIVLFMSALLYYLYGNPFSSDKTDLPSTESVIATAPAETIQTKTVLTEAPETSREVVDQKEAILAEENRPKDYSNHSDQLAAPATNDQETTDIVPETNIPEDKLPETRSDETPATNPTQSAITAVPEATQEVAEVKTEEKASEAATTNSAPIEETTANETAETPEVITEQEAKIVESPASTATTKITDQKKYGCFIVVGSFEFKKNAGQLLAQLKKESYPIYQGQQRGYHIVGVNCDCAKKTSQPLLKKLKKEVDQDAFLVRRK